MTRSANPHAPIELMAASIKHKPVLANLLELYAHDFSEFMELDIGPDGRFGYRDIDLYWNDPQRFPFLVKVSRRLAGFFLVQAVTRGHEMVWDMAEFFVLRGYRGRSIGTRVAQEAFAKFPGEWQVRVMECNLPAGAFWSHAVRAFAGAKFRLEATTALGKEWKVFSFTSPPSR